MVLGKLNAKGENGTPADQHMNQYSHTSHALLRDASWKIAHEHVSSGQPDEAAYQERMAVLFTGTSDTQQHKELLLSQLFLRYDNSCAQNQACHSLCTQRWAMPAAGSIRAPAATCIAWTTNLRAISVASCRATSCSAALSLKQGHQDAAHL